MRNLDRLLLLSLISEKIARGQTGGTVALGTILGAGATPLGMKAYRKLLERKARKASEQLESLSPETFEDFKKMLERYEGLKKKLEKPLTKKQYLIGATIGALTTPLIAAAIYRLLQRRKRR